MKWEDFTSSYTATTEWASTSIECPECGEYIKRNTMMVYTTYPPKFKFKCFKCGWLGYK